MNKVIIVISLIVLSTATQAQEPDYALVEKTVSFYLEGGTNNNYEELRKAFHPSATMKFIKGDTYTEVNALNFFKKAIKPGPKQNRTTGIYQINLSGSAASAILRIDYDAFYFMDYMNLLKIDGEWKIVSKIFSRENK
ncbi:MAG: nuclear transport factor 2 family protein [Bacteroidota bacterium]